jgi:hypothetical protein
MKPVIFVVDVLTLSVGLWVPPLVMWALDRPFPPQSVFLRDWLVEGVILTIFAISYRLVLAWTRRR